MRLHQLLAPILLLTCSVASAWDRAEPWHDPPPVPLLTRLSLQQVHDAIIAGGRTREWKVAGDQPGRLELMVEPRAHMLKVAVEYSTRQYAITYLDSRELSYREVAGAKVLHPSAISWVDNLIGAINIELLRSVPEE